MKLPRQVLSHCVSRNHLVLTPGHLDENLRNDLQLGYAGAVILPALVPNEENPQHICNIYKVHRAKGAVCGILGLDGPDPLDPEQMEAAFQSLRPTCRMAAMFANQGIGKPVVLGPTYTHHRNMRGGVWNTQTDTNLNHWLDLLAKASDEYGVRFLFEALGPREDATPNAFGRIQSAIYERPTKFGFHIGTGHAHARNIPLSDLIVLAPLIGHFEFENVGREMLRTPNGIDFWPIIQKVIPHLHHDCTLSVETFSKPVIDAFDLGDFCTTKTPGAECLAADAVFLREKGVMGPL